jgi:hypothetical protein
MAPRAARHAPRMSSGISVKRAHVHDDNDLHSHTRCLHDQRFTCSSLASHTRHMPLSRR